MRSLDRSLLLVWHSRTGLARAMAESLQEGALAAAREMDAADQLNVVARSASEASVDDVLAASGFLFCCPENLASASGEMLEFFHRSYYHAFDASEAPLLLGRPYGLAVAAGSDGSSAVRQIERICKGWRLKPVAPAFINRNGQEQTAAAILQPKQLTQHGAAEQCQELGGLVAATVLLAGCGE